MSEELRKKLSALRAAAPRMDEATDSAARSVKVADDFLRSLSLGVPAEVCFGTTKIYVGKGEGSRAAGAYQSRILYLAYGKIRGAWRLHVVEKTGTPIDPADLRPEWTNPLSKKTVWRECPRSTRLESVAALPRLLEKIADAALGLSASAASASATVKAVLDAFDDDDDDDDAKNGTVGRDQGKADLNL